MVRSFVRAFVVMAAATALTACASPSAQLPSQRALVADVTASTFDVAPAVAARSTAAAAPDISRWWTGFQDPVLTELVDKALAQNLDLAAAGARVDQARAAARAAGAQLLPIGQANAQAARARSSLESPSGKLFSHFPGYQRTGNLYDLNFGAVWEIDLFGRLRNNAKAASADAAAAEAGRAGVRLTIAAETADAYLQVRGLQQRLAATRALCAALDGVETLTAQKHAVGAASDIDLQQARAQAAQARANIPLLETGLEAQGNRLDVLVGQRPGWSKAKLATAAAIPAPPAFDPGAPVSLLRRRPDVLAAEKQLIAADARVGSALADRWPTISLSALFGAEATQTSRLSSGGAQLLQGAAGANWRVFNFGLTDAQIKAARGRRAEALANWKEAVLEALAESEDAMTSLVKREDQLRALDIALDADRRTQGAVDQAYQTGAASRIDALLAEAQALSAEGAAIEARQETSRAAVASFRALGGGWTAPTAH